MKTEKLGLGSQVSSHFNTQPRMGALKSLSWLLVLLVAHQWAVAASPPQIDQTTPADQTVQCGSNATFTVTVTNNSNLGYQWYLGASPINGAINATLTLTAVTFGSAGFYSVVVTNDGGPATSRQAKLTVVDTVPPNITCANAKTVECGTAWTFDAPTASDNCGSATISIVSTTTNRSCGETFTATRTWRATDGQGNNSTCSQTVTVRDTTPPTIACGPNKTVQCGVAWTFDVATASDQCIFDSLVFDDSVNDLQTRLDPGTLEVGDEIILAGDARYVTKFLFEYWGTNKVQSSFQGNVQARVRFYKNDGLPSSSGALTPGTVLFDSGPFAVSATPRSVVTFSDFQTGAAVPLTGAVPDAFTWSVQFSGLSTNDAAGVDLFSPVVVGNDFTDYWQHDLSGWVLKTNSAVPSVDFAAKLDASRDFASITVLSTTTNRTCGETFTATRTWKATDACGNTNACSQTVTVVDTTPPSIICAANKTVACGSAWTFDRPTAFDACVFDSLVYDDSVHDLTNRFNIGTLEVGDEIILGAGPRNVSRFVMEYWGTNSVQSSFQGNVQARVRFYINDGPASSAGPLTPGTVLFDSGPFAVSAATRSTVTITDFQTGAAVPLTAAVPNSFTWSVQFSGLSANDSAGLDLYSPPVVGQDFPDYWQHDLSGWVLKTNAAVVAVDFAALLDASRDFVTVAVVNTTTNRACGETFTATRTWSATDACGNTTNCSQSVTVVDTVPPTLVCLPSKTVQCGDTWTFDRPTAIDACVFDALVFDDSVHDLTNRFEFGTLEVGDEIILGAGPRNVSRFMLEYWGTNAVQASFQGNVQARVRFYINDGPASSQGALTPGAVLYDSGPFAVTATPRSTVTITDFQTGATVPLTAAVPDSFTWSIQFSGMTGNDSVGVDLFSPPVVGNDFTDYWQHDLAGWVLKTNAAVASMDFAALVDATRNFTTVAVVSTTTNANCGHTFTATRTWSATDACGNSTNCSQTVTVIDTLVPTIVCAANKTVECGSAWTFDLPAVTDNCGPPTIVIVSTTTNAACGNTFTATRTWRADDGCGHVTTNCSQIVTVVDTTLPTIICGANKTVECGTAWTFDVTVSDNCGTPTLVVVSATTNRTCGETFIATRTWHATDGCGNSSTNCSQTVTVVDTTPPLLTCVPSKTVQCGTAWDFDRPTAIDACVFDTLIYDDSVKDLTNRFEFGTLEVGDEIILGTGPRHVSRFILEYWGTNRVQASFQGNVKAQVRFYINDGPASSAGPLTPGTVLYDSGPFAVPATARSTITITDFQVDAAVPLTAAVPDSFTWSVQFSGLSANDSAGLDLYSPPVVGQDYPDYWQHDLSGWVLKTNSAIVAVDFAARVDASRDFATVAIVSTTTNAGCGGALTATRTWSATDACGNTTNCSQTVTVQDFPTFIVCPSPTTVSAAQGLCTAVVTYSVMATGYCSPVLSVQCTPPSGFAFPLGTTSVACVATNSCSRSNVCAFTVTVRDFAAPVVTSPPDITVQCNVALTTNNTGTATVTTTCNNVTGLTFSDASPFTISSNNFDGTTIRIQGDPITATAGLVNGPGTPPLGVGSFHVAIGANGENIAESRVANYGGVPIAALTELGYYTYRTVDGAGANQEIIIVLNIDTTGHGAGDDVIFFEPQYQNGANPLLPVQGATQTGVWQKWSATIGGWWSANHPGVMGPGNNVQTLDTYLLFFPNARIVNSLSGGGVRLRAGGASGVWDNFDGNADRLTVGTNGVSLTYDFEVAPPQYCPATSTIMRTFTATNSTGRTASGTQKIRVIDTVAPIFTACPANMTTNTPPGVCTTVVNFTVTATDACSVVTLECTPTSGFAFPAGTNLVVCHAWDACDNTNTCSFTVTVLDNQGPQITCPSDIAVTNDATKCGAVVTYVVTSADNCPLVTTQTAGLASGSLFPVGTTMNSFKVTDPAGSTATCSFVVTVTDTEPPNIACPANITTNNAAGQCRVVVRYTVPVGTDNCPGAVTVQTAGLTNGAFYPIGNTTNTFLVTDHLGFTATCSFVVTVNDTQLPVVTCPPSVTVNTLVGTCSSNVTFSSSATDNCSVTNLVCSPASGSAFGKGVTTVTCTATDASGNNGSCSFTVTVIDNEPPVIACPANLTVATAPGTCASNVAYTVVATDNCPGANLVCNPPSGRSFNKGVTTVSCTFIDAVGFNVSCSFTVTVQDQEPPTITCRSDLTVNAEAGKCTAVVTYPTPTTSDNCPAWSIFRIAGLPSGSAFPVGRTTNIFGVRDLAGNSNTCSFVVTVVDTQPPVITCPVNVTVNATAGGCASVVTFNPSATDNCSAIVTCTPASGTVFTKGVKTVNCTADDSHGNTNSCSFTVTVIGNQPPVVTPPPTVTVQCDQVANTNVTGTATAVDSCGTNLPVAFSDRLAVEVDPTHLHGWALNVTDGGTPPLTSTAQFVNGPGTPVLGTGSVRLAVGTNGESAAEIRSTNYNGILLSSLTELSYWAYRAHDGSGGQQVYIMLNIDLDNNGTIDDLLFFEPVYQDGTYNPSLPTQGPVQTGVWQRWNALVGGWWSANGIAGLNPANGVKPLSTYLAANPNARIVMPANGLGAIRLVAGFGPPWKDFDGNADGVSIGVNGGTITYDFEQTASRCANTVIVRTWTATDANANSASAQQMIRVIDTKAPSLVCPANIDTTNDTGHCSAVVTFAPTVADNCDTNPTVVCSPTSGTAFPVGTNGVTCTATDACGNTTNCSFTIIVRDVEPPAITCPANIPVSTTAGQCGAVVTYTTPVGTDNCPGAVTVRTTGLASGATYPVGNTTNTFVVTDHLGFTATCSFVVTVSDTQAPGITCPPSVTVNAAQGSCASNVTFSASATDNCSVTNLVCSPASGSPFTTGINTVNCTATDASGNNSSCSFTVTVLDTQPPVITCPANITTTTAAGSCSNNVSYTVLATDNCSVNLVCNPPSGRLFGKGVTTVSCTALDPSGNQRSCSFTVTVQDQELPAITCPANVTAQSDPGRCGTVVTYSTPVASDNCPAFSIFRIAGLPSGSVFPVGRTTNIFGARDLAGNSNTCSFVVTVRSSYSTNLMVNAAIPDNDPNGLASTITLSTPIGGVGDMNVMLSVSNGWNGDLYAYLVHKSGFAVLLNRVGRTATDSVGYGDAGFNVTLDDQADNGDIHVYRYTLSGNNTTPLGGPLTGFWAPDGRATSPSLVVNTDPRVNLLSAFNGLNPNGDWTLFIADLGAGDQSTLVSWGLQYCGLLAAPPSITTPPADQTVLCGNNATFSVTAAGVPADSYQWYFNTTNVIANATNSTLTITNVRPPAAGGYSVRVTNDYGNVTSVVARLTFSDVPPTVTCSSNLVLTTDSGRCSKSNVTFTATAASACTPLTVVCAPASGSTFVKGTTTVRCTATDAQSSSNTCTFTVTVQDTEPPALLCPTSVTTNTAVNNCFQIVRFNVIAVDNCGALTPSCTPPSGSVFQIGPSTVNCEVTDGAGYSASCSFTVNVTEPVPPVSIVRQGTNVVVSWLATCSSYEVQETTQPNLHNGLNQPSNVWFPANGNVTVSGGYFHDTIPITSAQAYFRLHRIFP